MPMSRVSACCALTRNPVRRRRVAPRPASARFDWKCGTAHRPAELFRPRDQRGQLFGRAGHLVSPEVDAVEKRHPEARDYPHDPYRGRHHRAPVEAPGGAGTDAGERREVEDVDGAASGGGAKPNSLAARAMRRGTSIESACRRTRARPNAGSPYRRPPPSASRERRSGRGGCRPARGELSVRDPCPAELPGARDAGDSGLDPFSSTILPQWLFVLDFGFPSPCVCSCIGLQTHQCAGTSRFSVRSLCEAWMSWFKCITKSTLEVCYVVCRSLDLVNQWRNLSLVFLCVVG